MIAAARVDAARWSSLAYFKALAVQLNRAGAIEREYGLRFFYHNHDFEFTTLRADGRPVYTVPLEEPTPRS